MKKLYSILLILLLAATAFAQTVAIGTGTSSSSSYGPAFVSTSATTRFSASATILTAAQIQAANGGVHFNNSIERLDWYIASGSGYTAGDGVLDIWLVATARADLSATESWGAYQTGATQVYSSTTQNFNTAAGYQSFEFNITTFPYNSETDGNLLILTQYSRPGAGPALLSWRYTSTSPSYYQRYFTGTSAILATTAMTRTTNRGNIRIYAPVPYAVGVTPVTANQTVGLGSSAWYQLTVTNLGTVDDSYTLSTSGSAWVDNIYDAIDGNVITSTGTLAMNGTFNAYVKVTVPGSATVGGTDVFAFSATSPNATASAARTTTASAGFTVTAVTANQSIGLGSSGWYQVNITNTGSINEAYDLSVAGNAWTTEIYNAIDGAVITNTGTVAPAGVFSAYVKVTVPSSTATLGLTDVFSLTAQSTYTSVTSATRTTTATYGAVYTTQQAGPPITYQWDDPIANGHTEIPYTLLSGTTDDGLFTFTMPEAFQYFNYTVPSGATVGIGTNGHLVFASTATPMTYSTVLRGITVWAKDLGGTATRPVGAQIFTKYDATNHTTTITWYNWLAYNWSAGTYYQFQCVLNHLNGGVTFRYNLFPTGYATLSNYLTGPRVGFINHATTTGQTALLLVTSGTANINTTYGGGTVTAGTEIQAYPSTPDPWGYSPANGAVNLDPAITTLSWTAPDQSNFDVYYGLTNPPALAASGQTGTTYAPALSAGNTYYWQIVHHYASRSDYTSSVMSFATAAADAPSGPLTGSIANVGATSFDVGWVDNSTNEDFFNIYVAEGAFGGGFDPATAPYAAQVASTTVAATGGAYTQAINGLNPNTTYAVRIYAANDNTVLMKNPGNGKIIRSEWVETETATPAYDAVVTTGKDGKDIVESAPAIMKAGKGYWRNIVDESNGTMGTDEIFYSSSFASASDLTLAATPNTPTVGASGVTYIQVTPNNNSSTPNSATTQYAIKCTTSETWVQANGSLGATAVWQTLALWGTANVNGLTPNTSYGFAAMARNANNVETALSGTASATTNTNVGLPLTEYFEGTAWPPLEWSIVNPDANKTWVQHTYSGNKSARINFWSYNSFPQSDFLITPPMDFTTVSTGSLFFAWSYLYHASYNDSLRVWVSPDNGATWTVVFFDGFNTLASRASDNNNPTGWRDTTIILPASVAGSANVIVKFEGMNDYGPDIFIDSVVVDAHHTQSVGNNPGGEGSQDPYTFTPPADPQTGNAPPVVVEFPAQTGGNGNPATVTVNVTHELPNQNPAELPSANTIHRYWDIQASSENFVNATLRLRFTTADLPSGITNPMTANPPIMAGYSIDGGNTWHYVTGAITDLGGGVYEMVITGLDHFSLWSLGNGGVLPVELNAFSAVAADRTVILNWRTESETNNDFFRVYRSNVSSERGELVGVVDGLGNNQTTHSYRFVDSRVQNGVTYYYRLADVDLNGIEALHPIIVNATPTAGANGIVPTEYALEQNMPNPFNPTTEIRYSVKEAGLVTLKVFDITGREVATLVNGNHQANNYRVNFDATKLSAGVYFYQIRVNDFYAVRKMVVAK